MPLTPDDVGKIFTGSKITVAGGLGGTVLYPVEWPDDGRPATARPLWHEAGKWTDGRTSAYTLEPRARYMVLRVPILAVGDTITNAEQLHLLPAGTLLIDKDGWAAQSQEDSDDETADIEWTIVGYGRTTDVDWVCKYMADPITVLRLPEQAPS